ITEHVNKVGAAMAEIAAGSEQQSQGIEQIAAGVEPMNGVTQQTAAKAEESSGQAEKMETLVGLFQLATAPATPRRESTVRANRRTPHRGVPAGPSPIRPIAPRGTVGRHAFGTPPSPAPNATPHPFDLGDDDVLEEF